MPGGAAVSSNRVGDATEPTIGPSPEATSSAHSEPQREAPSPERRVDQDGVAYTYTEVEQSCGNDAAGNWGTGAPPPPALKAAAREHIEPQCEQTASAEDPTWQNTSWHVLVHLLASDDFLAVDGDDVGRLLLTSVSLHSIPSAWDTRFTLLQELQWQQDSLDAYEWEKWLHGLLSVNKLYKFGK